MSGQPLKVTVYPAESSERWLYEDDGATMDYEKGQFVRRRFSQQRTMSADKTVATIEVGAPEGSWRPASRDLELTLPWRGEPSRVLVGGRELQNWTHDADGGFVTIKLPDRFEAVRITIEGLRQ
jgi:hypothetical protein